MNIAVKKVEESLAHGRFIRAEDDASWWVRLWMRKIISEIRLLGLRERARRSKKENVKKTMVRVQLKATNSLRSLLLCQLAAKRDGHQPTTRILKAREERWQ